VFFENHWENRVVRQWIKDIINAFQWGSILRDDIAHGVARAHRITITGNTYDFGTFHLPPDYNTGRTNLRGDGGGTSAPHTTARYRYVGEDIENIAHRFNVLRDVTQDRASTIYRVFDDGGGVSDLVKVIVDGQGEKR